MNSLLRQGSLLSQFYAEEHPSDGNCLAVAGGSTFGRGDFPPSQGPPADYFHTRRKPA
jgi:hypothetical protein